MSELEDLLDQILGRPGEHAGTGTAGTAWANLTETGLTRVGIAETLGGSGGELTDAATVTVAAAEAGLAVPVADTLFPVAYLAAAANQPVPPGIVAVASLPPGACTTADDKYRFTGSAADVAWGGAADQLWLLAPAHDRQTAFVTLDSGTWTADNGGNLAGEPRDRIEVDTTVARSAVTLLRRETVADLRLLGALGRSCQLLGALRTCLRLADDHVRTRTQFGTPLAGHQVVRHTIAAMVEHSAAAETAVCHAVSSMPAPGESPDTAATVAVAAAKVQTSSSATFVARAAHQLHGALGLTAEHPLHHFTTRLWSWRDEFGSADEWSAELARLVQSAYHADLWGALTGQR